MLSAARGEVISLYTLAKDFTKVVYRTMSDLSAERLEMGGEKVFSLA